MYFRALDDLPIDIRIAVLIPGCPSYEVLRVAVDIRRWPISPTGITFVEDVCP